MEDVVLIIGAIINNNNTKLNVDAPHQRRRKMMWTVTGKYTKSAVEYPK